MENQKPKEDIVNLIKKCLALSSSPNEHEATLAMEKAQELLLKYNLEMRDLEIKQEIYTLNFTNLPIDFPERIPSWKALLVHAIAKNNFCKVVTSGSHRLYILGRGFNVVAVMEMSVWISGQVEALAFANTACYQGRDKMSYRNSFLLGIVGRIGDRLKELQSQAMQANSNTTALVVDSRKALEDFTHTQFPHLGHKNYGSSHNEAGRSDGWAAGKDISLSAPSSHLRTQAQLPQGGN